MHLDSGARVLVTGGAGFIGSHYVRSLLGGELGMPPASVVVLDKLTYAGRISNLGDALEDPRLRVVTGDVCDPVLVDDLVRESDAVVHFAAESHVDRSIDAGADFARTNVLGTQVLLDAALRRGTTRFVHVSTDEVYGSVLEGSSSEDDPLVPTSPYAASKAGSDLLALAAARTHGLPLMITRCSNNYGPHQYPEKLIPLAVTNLLRGADVPVYGDGSNVRDWLHVDDHCRAVQAVLERGRPGEVYNVGGGTELTNNQLVERLIALVGEGAGRAVPVPDRKAHDLRYSVDWSKIRDELGYRPRVDFAEGLAATVEWYRSRPDW